MKSPGGSSGLEIRSCKRGELAGVVGCLDKAFVFGKHRTLSVCARFPNTLSADNCENVRVAIADGRICCALAIREFDWVTGKSGLRGAMVGMVWVHPDYRGRGLAVRAIKSAGSWLSKRQVDFGVLWTALPSLYQRAGWMSCDSGVFGEATVARPATECGSVSCRPMASMSAAWLERVRSRLVPQRVVRTAMDYRTVPLPAVEVSCFVRGGDAAHEGFALVGTENGTGYLYEMVAPRASWVPIWAAVSARFARLFVNGRAAEPFAKWLARRSLVSWQPQAKAMWLAVSAQAGRKSFGAWHIPYFDWI